MDSSDQERPPRSFSVRRSPVGASPGILIADPLATKSRLSLTLIAPDGCKTVEPASVQDLLNHCEQWPLVWLDCVGLADIEMIQAVGDIFGLRPLALEDTVNTGQRPKVDFYDDHAFVLLNMIDDVAADLYEQITVFFGEDFVVTFQERHGDPFDAVRKRLNGEGPSRLRNRKGDYLAYALIDAVVDSYFGPVERATGHIDRIEDDMIAGAQRHQVRELHKLRRSVMTMKRAIWPLRDAIAGLIRADVPFLTAETKVFLNDTQDHAIQLIELGETQRDTLSGLIDMHLSLSQAKTNDVISFLTVISSIFIPLTFIVGVWGMNFDPDASPWNMPELRAYFGYPAALASMLLVALSLIAYFKWRKWL